MSWILAGVYCAILWLVFEKMRWLRLTLPLAILLASVGPLLIVALLLCAQYAHPYTTSALVLRDILPIAPQLTSAGRVSKVNVIANAPVRQGDRLFEVDPVPYQNAVDAARASLAEAQSGVEVAGSSIELAKATIGRAEADLTFATNDRDRMTKLRESGGASQDEYERALTRYREALAASVTAEQTLTQSRASVSLAQTKVDAAGARLAGAQYDLDQTVVTAPADGFVTNLQLRAGALVGGPGGGPVMTLIADESSGGPGIVVAMFPEKNFRRIQPGQYAEVAMVARPGRILPGRVKTVIDVSGAGQLVASGILPTNLTDGSPSTFAVRIELDDKAISLPGGATGQAAVYTDSLSVAGIPVMFLIRAKSWLDYLN